MARLFFALWPDAPARAALADLAVALAPLAGGRPVPAAKIHLTLAFLGEVPEARVADAMAIAVEASPFRLELDEVGAFRGARVAWAGSSRPPPQLLEMQSRLAAALAWAGFALEERPFAPHVTLARGIAKPVPRTPVKPVAWTVESCALVRSEAGTGRYSNVREWPIGR